MAALNLGLVGDNNTGKTELLYTYARQPHTFSASYIMTIEVDYATKEVEVNGNKQQVGVYDVSGAERWLQATADRIFKTINGFVLCYSVADRTSFERLDYWVEQIKKREGAGAPVVLAALKSDSEDRKVTQAEGQAFAAKHGLAFVEASSKSNVAVEEVFQKAVAALSK